MKFKLSNQLILIFIIAIFFRSFLISDNLVYFWFDQARDANISQEIIANKDLKIQGPSASGTNDTIYHGVFYYYLLGPIYTIFSGNPFLASLAFGLLNSFSVFILYILVERLFNNKRIALLSAFLLAISFEHSQYSTWLSNPMMGLIPILFFFLSLWMIFYQEKKVQTLKWMAIMGLSLGLIEQSAFYSIYFFVPIIFGIIYLSKKSKVVFFRLFSMKEILAFLITYTLTIATMIINQLMLYKAGIFTLNGLEKSVGNNNVLTNPKIILEIFNIYFDKNISTLTPFENTLGILFIIFVLIISIKFLKKSILFFLFSWLTAPLWLFIFHFRSSPHMLLGIEYVIIILLSFSLIYLFNHKRNFLKILSIIILFTYVSLQFKAIIYIRQIESSIFTFQQGVMLRNELKLIDKTYQIANNKPFSISIWGSPYEYYISWAYLYDWYGKKKYGYVPTYYGTSQVGKFGSNLLTQNNHPEKIHFLIEEPNIILIGDIYESFIENQNSSSTILEVDKFGNYNLQSRAKKE